MGELCVFHGTKSFYLTKIRNEDSDFMNLINDLPTYVRYI
jgi:hypothetical protein